MHALLFNNKDKPTLQIPKRQTCDIEIPHHVAPPIQHVKPLIRPPTSTSIYERQPSHPSGFPPQFSSQMLELCWNFLLCSPPSKQEPIFSFTPKGGIFPENELPSLGTFQFGNPRKSQKLHLHPSKQPNFTSTLQIHHVYQFALQSDTCILFLASINSNHLLIIYHNIAIPLLSHDHFLLFSLNSSLSSQQTSLFACHISNDISCMSLEIWNLCNLHTATHQSASTTRNLLSL